MQREVVGLFVQSFDRVHYPHPVFFEHRRICIRIVGRHLHTHRLAVTSYQAPYMTVGLNPQPFTANFSAGARRKLVAGHEDHHTDSQLGHRIRILARRIHHDDAPRCAGTQIDVVVSRSGAHHDFKLRRGSDHLGGHLVAADDQRIGILHCGKQLVRIGVFLEQRHLVTRSLHNFTYPVHCSLGKWFLGSD